MSGTLFYCSATRLLRLAVMQFIYNSVLVTLLLAVTANTQGVQVDSSGCGTSKVCLYQPAGCNPNRDCTVGVSFYVIGPNLLRVEMTATALIPTVQQQYVAIAFSNDEMMGNDAVTECVMSDMGQFAGYEAEIFVSFNEGKSNDRIFLNTDEQRTFISNVSSLVVDGHMICQFTQQIVPQIDNKNNMIWNLDKEYYIMAATGSAQPDEVNAHDMNKGSHFYPIISKEKINPAKLTSVKYDLPDANPTTAAVTTSTEAASTTSKAQREPTKASNSVIMSFFSLMLTVLALF